MFNAQNLRAQATVNRKGRVIHNAVEVRALVGFWIAMYTAYIIICVYIYIYIYKTIHTYIHIDR